MYKIHVGAFPLNFPFTFEKLEDAKFALAALESLRAIIPSWNKELKSFQIWCTEIERWVKQND